MTAAKATQRLHYGNPASRRFDPVENDNSENEVASAMISSAGGEALPMRPQSA
jgi:hypothetical protein